MKLSEVIQKLAEKITEQGDIELSENFVILYEYDEIQIY